MAKFKYVGDPRDNFSGPPVAEHQGFKFPKGVEVEVPEDTDEQKAVVKKLRGNTHLVDLSDSEEVKEIAERQEAHEKAEEERVKRDEELRKANEEQAKKAEEQAAEAALKENKRGPGRPANPKPPETPAA